MTKELKKWIKDCGYFLKDVEFIDEPITTKARYWQLYHPSKGSTSGDGFCLFIMNGSKHEVYPMTEELNKKIFDFKLKTD